jgi:hypothetical protein
VIFWKTWFVKQRQVLRVIDIRAEGDKSNIRLSGQRQESKFKFLRFFCILGVGAFAFLNLSTSWRSSSLKNFEKNQRSFLINKS